MHYKLETMVIIEGEESHDYVMYDFEADTAEAIEQKILDNYLDMNSLVHTQTIHCFSLLHRTEVSA